jgi:hypothetical protein
MEGQVESLNAAIAAAVILFEIRRQRGTAPSRASHPGEGVPEGTAPSRASHPGEGVPEGTAPDAPGESP